MKHKTSKLSLAVVLALSGIGMSHASDSPFSVTPVGQNRLQLADAATAGDKPSGVKSIPEQLRSGGVSILGGKCGQGKCGSQRVRQMMDEDEDGAISRREYNQWINRESGSQFDRIDVNEDGIISQSEMHFFETSK